MPPVPRKEMLDVVKYYLERFKTDPEVKMMGKTRPGTAFELAVSKAEPGKMSMAARTPHVLDLNTGNMWRGREGSYHQHIFEEVPEAMKAAREQQPLIFVEETPRSVSYKPKAGKGELTPEQHEQALKTLQERFQKPVIDPVTGKVFGITGATAAGLGVTAEAQAAHEQSETIERDGKFYNISGLTGELLESTAYDTLEEATFAAEVRSHMTQQTSDPELAEIQAEMKAAQAMPDAINRGTHPDMAREIADSSVLSPEQKQLFFRSMGMVDVEQVRSVGQFITNIIEEDIDTFKTLGKTGFYPTEKMTDVTGKEKLITQNPAAQAAIRTGNLSLAMGDVLLAGALLSTLRKIPKALSNIWSKKPTTAPVPETVAKQAEKADAISTEGKVDPTTRTADALEYEYTQYYDEPAQSVQTWNIGGPVTKAEQQAISPPAGATREKQLEGLSRGDLERTGGIRPEKLEQVEATAYPKPTTLGRLPGAVKREPLVESAQQAQAAAQRAAKVAFETEDLLAVSKSSDTVPAKKVSLLRGLERKALAGTITTLRAAGPVGEDIAKRFIRYLDVPEQKTANALADIEQAWKKLTREEKDNLIDIRNAEFFRGHSRLEVAALAKNIAPISDRVKALLPIIQKHTGSVTDTARTVGASVADETRPFWPQHLIKPQNFENNEKFAKYLVETKQMPNVETAKQYMAQFARKYGEHKFAGIEKARTFFVPTAKQLREFGFDTELSALETYFLGANRRIQSFLEFGEDGHKGFHQLYDTLASQNKVAAEVGLKTFNRITNREMYDETYMKAAQALTTYSIWRHMGLSGIMQLLSHPSIFIRAGFRKGLVGTWRGLKSLNEKSPEYDFARRSGAIINNIMKDVHAGYTSGASDWYLKYNGTTFFDNLTRLMAAHTGKEFVKETVEKLIANPKHTRFLRIAKELDINVDKMLANGGLSTDEMYLAVKRFSDTTIGRTRAIDMPMVYGSPYLSMMTLFKKFAIFYTGFMYRHLFKEVLRHGNLRPLLPVAVVGLPAGELMATYRATAKDKERPAGSWKKIAKDFERGKMPKNAGDRIMDDLLTIQLFGMFGDLALAASYGNQRGLQRLEETFLGAPAVDTLKIVTAVANSSKQLAEGKITTRNHKMLIKEAIKHLEAVPFGVGAWLSQWTQEQVFPEMKGQRQQIWRK